MSVKIMTKLKLDTNAYNKLIIREEDGKYLVKISGNKVDDKYTSVFRLTDSMKKMGDVEKIITIVESFLENTQINYIDASTCCVGCSGRFIKVSGSRELYIQHIENQELLKKLIKMITEKYTRDRYSYVMNSNIKNSYSIVLNKDISYYNREFISCGDCEYRADCEKSNGVCPKQIQFRLMFENGKLLPFDKEFIERFVYDKLWEVGLSASVVVNKSDIKLHDGTVISKVVDGYSIACGDVMIKFNCSTFSIEYVLNFCYEIINRYNGELRNIEKIKKRQLKMEGF